MVICELRIELKRSTYQPGDVVEGRVRFRLDESTTCAVRVWLGYRGTHETVKAVQVFDGFLPAHWWHTESFRLALPDDAPPSIQTVASWCVFARADMKLAFHERAERSFRVEEPPDLYPNVLPLQIARSHRAVGADTSVAVPGVVNTRGGRTPRSLARDVASTAAGTALMGVGVGLVTLTKGLGVVHSAGLFVPGYQLTQPGIGRVRRWMAERRVGVVRVEYATVFQGDQPFLKVSTFVEPGLTEDGVNAKLLVTAREQKVIEPIFERELELERQSRRGDIFEGLIPLTGAPPRSGTVVSGVEIRWELQLHIDIPRWPDWVETFPLTVLAARR